MNLILISLSFIAIEWYHLPCGIANGSVQVKGTKDSFCHEHANELFGTRAGILVHDTSESEKPKGKRKPKKRGRPPKQLPQPQAQLGVGGQPIDFERWAVPGPSREIFPGMFEHDDIKARLEMEFIWSQECPNPDPIDVDHTEQPHAQSVPSMEHSSGSLKRTFLDHSLLTLSSDNVTGKYDDVQIIKEKINPEVIIFSNIYVLDILFRQITMLIKDRVAFVLAMGGD